MKRFNETEIHDILSLLFNWFACHKRPLPWRVNYLPYEVWISEMMLQQTQMDRGVKYYLRWMEQFPTVYHVASASLDEILQAWEGLGYYSRARNLHATAKIICEQYAGIIPSNMTDLRRLPGIGDYTASAILGIAYEKDFVTVDANVERVFARLCDIDNPKLKELVKKEAVRFLPLSPIDASNPLCMPIRSSAPHSSLIRSVARTFNQAWMEFGALVCNKKPSCIICPLESFCESKKYNLVRPVPKQKKAIIAVHAVFGIIFHHQKGYLLRKRPPKGLWAGMWEFVGLDIFNKSQTISATLPASQTVSTTVKKYTEKNVQQSILKNDIINMAYEALHIEYTNIFSHTSRWKIVKTPCIQVEHSYTNHRLFAMYFQINNLNNDMDNMELDTKINTERSLAWVKDMKTVAMPSHHRKAFNIFIVNR